MTNNRVFLGLRWWK